MKSRARSVLIFVLLSGIALGGPPAFLAWKRFLPFSGRVSGIRTERKVQDFVLTDSHARRTRLSDTNGLYRYVFFGFTKCPSLCPRALGLFRRLERSLPADHRVLFLFISIDPEHDNPAVLTQFLAGFPPTFLGFTGTPPELESVGREFGAQASTGGGPLIEHAGTIYLLDPAGRIVLIYPKPPQDVQTMLADLAVLRETNL